VFFLKNLKSFYLAAPGSELPGKKREETGLMHFI
jgi:hypothetical protein